VLGVAAAAIGQDASADEAIAQLMIASGEVANCRVLLDDAQLRKAVSQTHMESGDIELF
jgi:hypothetical protein